MKPKKEYQSREDINATVAAYRQAYVRGDVVAMRRLRKANPSLVGRFEDVERGKE